MRRLLWIIACVMLLMALATGCGGAHRYDSRLTAVDSLMQPYPDSALALVQAISPASLTTEGDRAYRDLLLTQARYRCYITATSDSDINRALDYYRHHDSDREKLTRAYIYKGAVMDELGHPDSAMIYYKTAEATAAPTDYFNLGYTNLQMATLYQDELSKDTSQIIHLKQAIFYFEHINDTNYLISCYGHLGGVFGIKHPDSTEFYLKKAIELAVQSNSTKQYTYKSKLAGLYFYHNQDYTRSKDIAMEVMRNGKEYSKETQFYYYAAFSFIKLGILDSAKYVLNETPAPKDAVDSMNRHQVVAEIAKAEKDLLTYGENLALSKDNQIQIINNKNDRSLKVAESDFSRAQAEHREAITKHNNRYIAIALTIALTIIALLFCLTLNLKRLVRKNMEEKIQIERTLTDTINQLQAKQQQLQKINCSVSELVGYRIDALNELFDSIRFKIKNNSKNRSRTIIPLSSLITELEDAYRIMNIHLSDKFWQRMKKSVDGEYKGIQSYVEEKYPNLTVREKRLFCLLCANVTPQIIKLCLNYTNVKSVSNYRNIIIKKKMGLNMTFDEFIDKYVKNEL